MSDFSEVGLSRTFVPPRGPAPMEGPQESASSPPPVTLPESSPSLAALAGQSGFDLPKLTRGVQLAGTQVPQVESQAGIPSALLKADPKYMEGVNAVLAKPEFAAAGVDGRAKVIGDLTKLMSTDSYAQALKSGKTKELATLVGSMSLQRATHPGPDYAVLGNTLDRVLGADNVGVTLNLYSAKDGRSGTSSRVTGTVNLNLLAVDPANLPETMSTLAEEVNHSLNSRQDNSADARFLEEYRAKLAGTSAGYGSQSQQASQQLKVAEEIFKDYGYETIYKTNKGMGLKAPFNAAYDRLIASLKSGSPVPPEQLRQVFLQAYGKNGVTPSAYFQSSHNADNSAWRPATTTSQQRTPP